MTNKDIILEVISKSDEYSTIKLNVKTSKIEMNGYRMPNITYEDILYKCKSEYPDTKFTKSLIKDCVAYYAQQHKYEPALDVNKNGWMKYMDVDDNGNIRNTMANIVTFLKEHPQYKGKFAYNEFLRYENYNGAMITDADVAEIRHNCEQALGFDNKSKLEDAIKYVIHENSFHPFTDKIDELMWDGTERLENFFIDTVNVDNTELNKSLTKKWFYALIKRLYEPGCMFDNMLIVYDQKQGTGKTKVVENLVKCLDINYGYTTTITCDTNDKDNITKLNATWIVGIDELTDFLKKTPEQTKQFVSQSSDVARLAWAKRSETYYRHCVFYGSTNVEYFLKDYSSNYERRYWIMNANGEKHNPDWWEENFPMEYYRQVIAEAKYLYDNEPNFNYMSLNIDEENELGKIQYAHKTLNNDDLLQDKVYKVLNAWYTQYEYNTYEEWLFDVNRKLSPSVSFETEQFFGESVDNNKYVKLDKLPVKYLKQYIHEEINRQVSTQYITALISQNWCYKACEYNGRTVNCYKKI